MRILQKGGRKRMLKCSTGLGRASRRVRREEVQRTDDGETWWAKESLGVFATVG